MDPRRRTAMVSAAAMLFTIVACAAEKKDNAQASEGFTVTKEQLVLVKEFSTQDAGVLGDKSDNAEKAEAKVERVPTTLAAQIVKELTERGYRAAPYTEAAAASGTYVLDGSLDVISSGSGAARFLVGFGAGKAEIIGNIRLLAAESPGKALLTQKIKGTSKGRISPGSLENITVVNFAKNTADAVTGFNREGKPVKTKSAP